MPLSSLPSKPELTREQAELRSEMDAQRAIEESELQSKQKLLNIEMLNLSHGLSISKFEITQAQWQAVMGTNPAQFSVCGDSCPIENVSWNEVQNFLTELNIKTELHYRLPSEDEWINACRAGGHADFCGGNEPDSIAWYAGNSQNQPHTVGQKQANPWGIYDMSGNVSEWTKSCVTNDCSKRVVCGGSWINSKTLLILNAHDWLKASFRNSRVGFRVVLDR